MPDRRPVDFRAVRPFLPGAQLVTTDLAPYQGAFTWPHLNRLLPRATCPLQVARQPFAPPADLHLLAEPVADALRARGALVFDGPGVRLATDLTAADLAQGVTVQPVSFFDGLVTNHLAFRGALAGALSADPTDRFFERGQLLSLSSSPAANRLGAAALAITADGFLVLTRQGAASVSVPGRWAPSSSGGMDPADLASGDLLGAARALMRREMVEECGLDPAMIARVVSIAYTRDIAQAGKPDFFGLARLEADFAQVCRIDAEAGLVDGHWALTVDLSSPAALAASLRQRLAELGEVCFALACMPDLIEHHRDTTLLDDLLG